MSRRDPTPWEVGCLYAALCAMAIGDQRTADEKIALCTLGETGLSPPIEVLPPLSVADLRDAFEKLEKPGDRAVARQYQQGLFARPILAIIALLATFVMLHP